MAEKKSPRQKPIDSYSDSITFRCPVRGEITQIVTVNVYGMPEAPKAAEDPEMEELFRQEGVLEED